MRYCFPDPHQVYPYFKHKKIPFKYSFEYRSWYFIVDFAGGNVWDFEIIKYDVSRLVKIGVGAESEIVAFINISRTGEGSERVMR